MTPLNATPFAPRTPFVPRKGSRVKRLLVLPLAIGFASCAITPPPPPECEGDLVRINAGVNASAQGNNDAARPRP